MKIIKKNKKQIRLGFYAICVIVVLVKCLFVHLGGDEQYHIVMSYRRALGDAMFSEMLEPHQTSAYMCAYLIRCYLFFMHTTNGLVLYLRFASVLVKLLAAFAIFKCLRQITERDTALVLVFFFLITSPKDIVLLEFANMQLYMSIFCGFSLYYAVKETKVWMHDLYILLAAVFLCGMILAYPSAIAAYLACILFLGLYSERGKLDILLLTSICMLGGIFMLDISSIETDRRSF